jgi:type VI secretion system secreted protein Hcp
MAAIDIFLNLAEIPGESTDKTHGKEIDVLAWSWGMTQTGNAITGSGKPVIQDISFTKYVDASTPLLITAGVTGKIIPSALLTVRKAGVTPFEYLKITLTNVMVASISSGGSGVQDRFTEDVTFSFEQFKIDYTTQKADGTAGTTFSSSYNIKNGK